MKEIKSSSTKSGFGIEELLGAAYKRTKERFLPYILGYLLSFAMSLGVIVVFILLAVISGLIWGITKSTAIGMTIASITTVVGFLGLFYVSSWVHLAIAYIIIAPKKIGVTDAYKYVKPLIWNYVRVMALTGVFLFGLLPFGILSLTVIFFLWVVWGMFTAFVFLERKESGLKSLFMSKAIVSTKFLGVILRMIIIYAAYLLIMYLLGLSQAYTKNSGVGGLLIFILGIVATPFIMSYVYEIYNHLEHPTEAKSNTVWIVLSVIGWIINIGLIVLLMSSIGGVAEKIMKDKSLQKDIMKQLEGGDKRQNKEFNQVLPKDI